MNINELVKKYELTKDDCWNLQRGGKSMWIITHDGVEKIAAIENILVNDIKVLNSERDFMRVLVYASKGEKKIITVGEAMKGNCVSNYIGCMAEKRGIDRAVLKLIDAYQYGIFSDSESDDFKRGIDTPSPDMHQQNQL